MCDVHPFHVALDVEVRNHGSVCIVVPLTDSARTVFDEIVPEDAQWWGGGVVVEPRYLEDFLEGAMLHGLVVE